MYQPLAQASEAEKPLWIDGSSGTHGDRSPRRGAYASVCTSLIIHLFLICVYTSLFFFLLDRGYKLNGHKSGLHAYSPAWEAIKWEARTLENQLENSNPFKGPPRPELDDAWNKLLGPSAIRVDGEVLDKINRTSVPLLDGSGFMVGLDVYHQLHCVKYIRKFIHPEYYNITEPNVSQHVDHCLESIRQYIMCNADVALLTFDWIPNFHRPWPNFRITHECVNWDSIEEWALAHSFDGFDPQLIKHPNFQPELPSPFDYLMS